MGVMYYKDENGNVYPINKGPRGDVGPSGSEQDIINHEAKPNPHNQYQLRSEKGNANGYAPLDAQSKVPSVHLPTMVTDHQTLTGRSSEDAHPQSSITGLTDALAEKATLSHTHTATQVNGVWRYWVGSQEQYNAVSPKDIYTLYVVI